MTRRKCPAARSARGGECVREGCECLAPKDCRLCRCCATQVGHAPAQRLSNMWAELRRVRPAKRPDVIFKIRLAEDELLACLGNMSLPTAKHDWSSGRAPGGWGAR